MMRNQDRFHKMVMAGTETINLRYRGLESEITMSVEFLVNKKLDRILGGAMASLVSYDAPLHDVGHKVNERLMKIS